MKEYSFDYEMFVKTCMKYGVNVGNSSGKMTVDGKEQKLSEIIDKALVQAKEKMSCESYAIINSTNSFIINGIESGTISACNYYSDSLTLVA